MSNDPSGQSDPPEPQSEPGPSNRKILIGSQRDPAALLARRRRDWVVPEDEDSDRPFADAKQQPAADEPATGVTGAAEQPPPEEAPPAQAAATEPPATEPPATEPPATEPLSDEPEPPVAPEPGRFPPPNIREQLPPDLEEELNEALGDEPLDDLMRADEAVTSQPQLESESRHTGRVVVVHREDVFVELGGREQGTVPLKHFDEPPEPGTTLEVIVSRFDPDEGLYELLIPNATADVADWSDLAEGIVVEARVTGHNSGGLECEVNHIRGFIPVSQISLYRVENLEEFVGQKFSCLVTEANPRRQNLVLSRRAVLEREREEARQKLLESLAPGQIHEGVVRKLLDFGAFVDLGGVDGLLHISQLGFGRVNHPSDVLSEGQTIKVTIQKVDTATHRISLGYRDMLENPWNNAARNYPTNTVVKGKVAKLMEFGAFVELEPGVEGLVHISELSHKRVHRVSEVVGEGDEVDVLVKSVDAEAQRIGLSIKDVMPEPEPAETEQQPQDTQSAVVSEVRKKPSKPLKGGLGRSSGGEAFGLKW